MTDNTQNPDNSDSLTAAYMSGYHDGKKAAAQEILASLGKPEAITEEWHGQSNINSRFNACQHKEYCVQLQQAKDIKEKAALLCESLGAKGYGTLYIPAAIRETK